MVMPTVHSSENPISLYNNNATAIVATLPQCKFIIHFIDYRPTGVI